MNNIKFAGGSSFCKTYDVGPYGEIPCEINLMYYPRNDYSERRVEILGARALANGRMLDFFAEEAWNLHPDIEDDCLEWAANKTRELLDAQKGE